MFYNFLEYVYTGWILISLEEVYRSENSCLIIMRFKSEKLSHSAYSSPRVASFFCYIVVEPIKGLEIASRPTEGIFVEIG